MLVPIQICNGMEYCCIFSIEFVLYSNHSFSCVRQKMFVTPILECFIVSLTFATGFARVVVEKYRAVERNKFVGTAGVVAERSIATLRFVDSIPAKSCMA